MSLRISVITINYNNKEGLNDTVTSVISQTYKELEYIVIDGGSTDGSAEVIQQNENKISFWVSEKDNGIYNAMNKGILKASGDYLLFLNSGDYLVSNSIISDVIHSCSFNEDIIYGDLFFKYDDDKIEKKQYPDKLTFSYFFNYGSLPHSASFIKKTLFSNVGLYNEHLKIVSDWEFWLKAIFLQQATYKRVPMTISVFGLDGISSDQNNSKIIRSEMDYVFNRFFPRIVDDYTELQSLTNDKRVSALKQLKQYPVLSKIATGLLLFLSWLIENKKSS